MPKPLTYIAHGKTVYLFRFKRPDDGKRTKIRLHDATPKYAADVGDHLDVLLQANLYQTDLPPKTSLWLSEVTDRFYDRLVGAGLIEPRTPNSSSQLGKFLEEYIDLKSVSRSYKGDWGQATTIKREQTANDLKQFFGTNKNVRDVSAEDAQRWKNWLLGAKSRNLSQASTSKKLKDARQFFEFAVDMDLIDRNPFAKLKLPPQDNAERMHYIPKADIKAVLAVIPDQELRLLIALARYSGFRTPSEGQHLHWQDINWTDETMLVFSPKLARDNAGGRRVCPIFPELVPFFRALPTAGDRKLPVMPSLTSLGTNLRTQFNRYVVRAGLQPWPKLFHNLRASALTDLVEEHSLPKVCKWLGTSPKIAMKHYFMIRGRELADPQSEET